jgi:hypothetical protein
MSSDPISDVEKNAAALESSSTGRDSPGAIDEKVAGELPKPAMPDFPEGGLRAWLVVFGTAATLFCTFGYANAFG